ncbi:dTDP-4-dehydrorhamnose reductase family protein [Methylotuvimicrobium sp. KM1]|uniref:dTDP-4-dehydrorhamnose reductase family protein n=1 Tax=Methylotuvimicrobium sp. KM1 TaxID=3377707 RepID=UPI00384C3760
MRVLVLGATGMLGHAVLKFFVGQGQHETFGTIRSDSMRRFFDSATQRQLISGVDLLNQDVLIDTFSQIQPEVVINAVGLIKQLDSAKNPLVVLPVNSLLPHRLSKICKIAGVRLVHVSTDCVFSGQKGNYTEADASDAEDLYGKSKHMGELHDDGHAITLRTSIIGHELNSNHALVDWFLSQQDSVKGYRKAIFSGLPTVELAHVIHDWVLPNPALCGLYHLSAKPISKFDLLKLIAMKYHKTIDIQPDDRLIIDRSLNSERFTAATGYVAPDWPNLVELMHKTR